MESDKNAVALTNNMSYRALEIVIRHLLTPENGWSTKSLEDRRQTVKAEIIQHFIDETNETDITKRLEIAPQLETKLMKFGSKFDVDILFRKSSRGFDSFVHDIDGDNLPTPISVSFSLLILTAREFH
jgi:hypothetical protein